MKKLFLFSLAVLLSQFVSAQDTIVKYNGDQIRAKIIEITSSEIKFKKFDFLEGPTYSEKKSEIQMIKYANGIRDYFEKQKEAPAEISLSKDVDKEKARLDREHDKMLALNAELASNKIGFKGVYYRYKSNTIKEEEVHRILLTDNDPQIKALIKQARNAKHIQLVGFAAIPFGVTAVVFAWKGLLESDGSFSSKKDPTASYATAVTCGLLTVACPITSGVFKHRRTSKTREAIMLHNEKY